MIAVVISMGETQHIASLFDLVLTNVLGMFNIFLARWLAIIEGCFAILHFFVRTATQALC